MLDVLGLEVRLLRFRRRRASLLRRMCAMLARQVGAPNSPQWFNTGLHWAYGIPARRKALVRRSVRPNGASLGRHLSHPQVSACYILGLEDDLVNEGGIFDGVLREARIFKGGSGSGANFSKLRSRGRETDRRRHVERIDVVSQGLRSHGRAIRVGGTTRRAAKMVVLNADHADIEEFLVNWKVREERKVADLIIGSRIFEKQLNAIISAAHDARVRRRASGSHPQCVVAQCHSRVHRDGRSAGCGTERPGLCAARLYAAEEIEQYDTACGLRSLTSRSPGRTRTTPYG